MSLLLLPLTGAILGYATNWIAVWMLFHPRKEVRIFDRRLFHAGVIPRGQEEIAQQFGETVTEELLRPEDLGARLLDDEVVRAIHARVVDALHEAASAATQRSPLSALPLQWREQLEPHLPSLRRWLVQAATEALARPALRLRVEGWIDAQIVALAGRRLADLPTDELVDLLQTAAANLLDAARRDPRLRRELRSAIQGRAWALLDDPRPLRALLPFDLGQSVSQAIRERWPAMMDRAWTRLDREDLLTHLRAKVAHAVVAALRGPGATLSEGMFKWIASMNSEQLLRSVDAQLQVQVAALRTWSYTPAAAQRAADGALAVAERVGDLTLADLVEQLPPGSAERWVQAAANELVTQTLDGEGLSDLAHTLLDSATDDLRHVRLAWDYPEFVDQARSAARGALHAAWPVDGAPAPPWTPLLDRVVDRSLRRLVYWPIPADLDLAGIHESALHLTRAGLIELANAAPRWLSTIDLAGLVADRVRSYPPEQFERVVMAGSKKHLRRIELFGGVLGFIVGVAQLGFMWLAGVPY